MKTSLEHLKPLMRCSLCDHKYEPNKALLLEDQDGQTTFHVTCSSCGVSTMVFVSTGQFGVISMGVLTDLKGAEVKNLYGNEAISSDQVLDIHTFFKSFAGSVKEFI
jgi:rubredoxin